MTELLKNVLEAHRAMVEAEARYKAARAEWEEYLMANPPTKEEKEHNEKRWREWRKEHPFRNLLTNP